MSSEDFERNERDETEKETKERKKEEKDKGNEEKEKEEEKETEKLFREKERKGLLLGLAAAEEFALTGKDTRTTTVMHHGPASKRRLAAIRKGHRTKIQTTFSYGEWRSTVWIQDAEGAKKGWDYVAVWRNGKAEYAYRVVRSNDGAGRFATPVPIGFSELP